MERLAWRGGGCKDAIMEEEDATSVPAMRFTSAFARSAVNQNLKSLHVSNVRGVAADTLPGKV